MTKEEFDDLCINNVEIEDLAYLNKLDTNISKKQKVLIASYLAICLNRRYKANKDISIADILVKALKDYSKRKDV